MSSSGAGNEMMRTCLLTAVELFRPLMMCQGAEVMWQESVVLKASNLYVLSARCWICNALREQAKKTAV